MGKITNELLKELGFIETQAWLWNNGVFKIAMDGNDCYTVIDTDK